MALHLLVDNLLLTMVEAILARSGVAQRNSLLLYLMEREQVTLAWLFPEFHGIALAWLPWTRRQAVVLMKQMSAFPSPYDQLQTMRHLADH